MGYVTSQESKFTVAVSTPHSESSESSVFPVGPIGGRMKDKTVDITPVKPILNALIPQIYINLSRISFFLRGSLIAFQITLLRYTSFSPPGAPGQTQRHWALGVDEEGTIRKQRQDEGTFGRCQEDPKGILVSP